MASNFNDFLILFLWITVTWLWPKPVHDDFYYSSSTLLEDQTLSSRVTKPWLQQHTIRETGQIPLKNTAEKPVFCTVLSVEKVIRSLLPSDVMGWGSVEPQNVPCTLPVSSPSAKPLRSSTESYSQSCCNTLVTHPTLQSTIHTELSSMFSPYL